MCEPLHSIVQFPDQDDHDNPTGPMIDTIPPNGDPLWSKMKAKIKNWFMFSRLGFGHSESMEFLPVRLRERLPLDTKYEVQWWDRVTKLDGKYYGKDFDREDALMAATTYAQRTSIGNLTLLRQFLEVSITKTSRPGAYLEQFVAILNQKGREVYNEKIRRILKAPVTWLSYLGSKFQLEVATKLMLGFTRKRSLLVPEWADDAKLWLPPTIST